MEFQELGRTSGSNVVYVEVSNSTTVYTSAENTMFSRNSTNGIQGKAKVGQKGICFHSVTDQTIVEYTL